MRRQPQLDRRPARHVLEELADEPARRALDEAQQHRVAGAAVVGRVEVEADVVTRLRVEIERARVRIVRRTGLERPLRQSGEELDERRRPVERHDGRRLLAEGVEADAPALLVARDEVAVDGRPHALDLGQHALDQRGGQPPLETDELVLGPVLAPDPLDVERRQRAGDRLRHRCRRVAHPFSPASGLG